MTRRTLLLALPQVLEPDDPWKRLAEVWNPFVQKLNRGELDLKLWKKVLAAIDRIEARTCK